MKEVRACAGEEMGVSRAAGEASVVRFQMWGRCDTSRPLVQKPTVRLWVSASFSCEGDATSHISLTTARCHCFRSRRHQHLSPSPSSSSSTMAEVASIDMPDLLDPDLNSSLPSPTSNSPPPDSSFESFNLDYLTMKHDAEIASIRAHLPSSQAPPSPSSSSPRRPQSAGVGGRVKGDSHRLRLLSAEKSLLEDRIRMMERLLSQQSREMEEYVTSTASLYVKLSDHQHALTNLTHQRDHLDTQLNTLRISSDALQKDNARLHSERDREREANERHLSALKKELTEVRSRWVESTAQHDRLTDEYHAHEDQFSRRIDELERQRERWEKADRTAVDLQSRVEELRRENERLKEETVRVGQLTAEVAGMHEVVERIYAERKVYEEERIQWGQERREGEKRERELKDAVVTAQLETEKMKREVEAIQREREEGHQRHQREVVDVEQRRSQDKEEGTRQAKLLRGEIRALREQIHRLEEVNERLSHPSTQEEMNALRGQLMQAKDECLQLKDRLHNDDIARITAQQQMHTLRQQVSHLTSSRHRLIQRIQLKVHQQTLAQSFYQWSARIQVKKTTRQQEEALKREGEERREAEVEERRREKAEVDRTLKAFEEKLRRMEDDRHKEEGRRTAEDRRRQREEEGGEGEKRREKERQERHRQRGREEAELREKERMDEERETREREEREDRERQRRGMEGDRGRSVSPQRHHHRHYVSPSTSPIAGPLPFSYYPALSALLALNPSSSSPEDVQLADRMKSLLSKLRTLQQMKEEKEGTPSQSAVERKDSGVVELPAALLVPPTNVGLLVHRLGVALRSESERRGKENQPFHCKEVKRSLTHHPAASTTHKGRLTGTTTVVGSRPAARSRKSKPQPLVESRRGRSWKRSKMGE